MIAQLRRALDLLGLIEAPSIELVAKNLKIFALLRVHAALNLLLVLNFLFVAKVGLLRLQFVVLVGTLLAETVGSATGKPGAHMTLDFQSDCLTLLVPHGGGHIFTRVDDLVIASVDVKSWLLHLNTEFAHHLRRLGLVLIRLNLALYLFRVEVASLICLREGVVVRDARAIVTETSKVGLLALLLLNSHCYYFHLVVCQTDLNLKLVGHDEFICLD